MLGNIFQRDTKLCEELLRSGQREDEGSSGRGATGEVQIGDGYRGGFIKNYREDAKGTKGLDVKGCEGTDGRKGEEITSAKVTPQ